jgi:phage shock protein PspC (stress-responsive transcriptional regulator)
MLLLVAVSALSTVNLVGPQDRTRYELARHVVLYHSLTIEPGLFDSAIFDGRSYSDKAPGMSALLVPAYEVERLAGIARAPRDWQSEGDLSLWLLRVLTSGALFVCAVFLVGRVAESLVPRTGAAAAATFGTATLASPLAPTLFEHDAAASLAFAAFVLVWRARQARTLVLAGLCAGLAVFFSYVALLVAIVVAAYCARSGARRLGAFILGVVPPAAALAAYDWAAFGSPFHLSYRYVANPFAERQHHGFFGIGVPTLSGLREVLVGNRGLLVFSPVTLAAVVGLWLMWRQGHRAEALVAAGLPAAFLLVNAGYFLPYGGTSPGPRFLAVSLPFLALGLPFAFRRFPVPTLALAALSAALTTADAVTWGVRPFDDPAWIPGRDELSKTVWAWAGVNRIAGAGILLVCALAAVAIGGAQAVRSRVAVST